VVHALVEKGETVLEPLQRYMKSADNLGYPLKILGEIARPERALQAIDEILSVEEPGYARNPARRIDVIEWLSELSEVGNEEIVRRVAPYMKDFDENVRFKTVEAIALKPHPSAAAPLVEALVNPEEESGRLKQRIAEVLAENDLELAGRKTEVAALLDGVLDGYRLHRDRLQKKT
jgi:HEAT repeat protein